MCILLDCLQGVPHHVFWSKRKSHLIKKDLWKHAKPVIEFYAKSQGNEVDVLAIVENRLDFISSLDKQGDNFRYPTTYSLEYKINNCQIDLKCVYEYMREVVNFLDSCNTVLSVASDYENEMRFYCE